MCILAAHKYSLALLLVLDPVIPLHTLGWVGGEEAPVYQGQSPFR